jgi:hypothetical protein
MRKLSLPEEEQLLNPEIKETKIGKKKLRTLEIIPLSLGDQTKMIELVSESFIHFYEAKGGSEVDFALLLKAEIKKNLASILSLITDEDGDKLLDEITNSQVIDIVELVFDMNFAVLEKKVKEGSLLGKIKAMFGLAESTLKSSGVTPNTDLRTSPESDSEKVD